MQYDGGTVEEAENTLRDQKAKEPNRIPYLICRRGSPGYVNLMYLPSERWGNASLRWWWWWW